MKTKYFFILFISLFSLPSITFAQSFLDKVLKGVEKTNKILDQTDKILGTGDKNSSSTKSRNTSRSQIVSPHPDIEIQWKRCVLSGTTAIIDMIVTNYGKDTEIQLGGSSQTQAFDDAGNVYPQIEVSIADGPLGSWKTSLFPTEIPLKFRLQIMDIAPQASVFKRINIHIYSKNLNIQEPIILYNIPIIRRDNSVNLENTEKELHKDDLGALENNPKDISEKSTFQTDQTFPITPQQTKNTKIISVDFSPWIATFTNFHDGVCWICDYKTHLWAAFDTTGTQIFDFKYYFDSYSQNPEFENGYCPVRDQKGSYIIDKKGNVIQPKVKIRDLSNFCDGIATASYTYPNPQNKLVTLTKCVYVNTKGEMIFPHLSTLIKWDRIKPMRPFLQGLAAHFDYEKKKWGFINHAGKLVIPAIYNSVQDFHDDYAAVKMDNNKWGFIDTSGTVKIQAIYTNEPSPFSEGFATVSKKDGGICIINKEGKTLMDQIYNISPFYKGRAFVFFESSHPYFNGNYYCIIDTNMQVVKKTKSFTNLRDIDGHLYWPHEEDHLLYHTNCLINIEGAVIYEAGRIRLFYDNRAFCDIEGEKKNYPGYINREGAVIFLFKENDF